MTGAGSKKGIGMGIAALALYLIGGGGIFGGIALIVLMEGKDLMGWGDGRSFGYLVLAVGLCLSMMGVLLMRLYRNWKPD